MLLRRRGAAVVVAPRQENSGDETDDTEPDQSDPQRSLLDEDTGDEQNGEGTVQDRCLVHTLTWGAASKSDSVRPATGWHRHARGPPVDPPATPSETPSGTPSETRLRPLTRILIVLQKIHNS